MAVVQYKNNKEEVPWEYYMERFRQIDPVKAAARCRLPYEEGTREFAVTMMGTAYRVRFPDFAVTTEETGFAALRDMACARILLARYLIDGLYLAGSGRFMTFREAPWGEVYARQFAGRCVNRLAGEFGTRLPAFAAAMERLGGGRISAGDAGYRIEFLPGFEMEFILWEADEEFPASAQILFSDNIPRVFAAEDMAGMGDVSLTALGRAAEAGRAAL